MKRTRRLAGIALVWAVCLPAAIVDADDALVLPKGRSTAYLENLFYFPTTQRFNPHGNPESIASGFNGRSLDSTVFPALQPLDPLVGGRASIGDSNLRFKYEFDILNFGFAYGVTDRLTVGLEIPYYWVHNNVDASIDSGPGSSANVGLRTGPGPGPCALASPVLPLACPNTRRFTTEDVQQLLGPGLNGIPGFGFKRIRNFFDFVNPAQIAGQRSQTVVPTQSLFLMNHWSPPTPRQQPDPVADAQVNATDVLVGRARACQAARGLLPTIIAVDQFKTGGLFAAVRQLP